MGGINPGTAREEAERLVTTALAAVRLAASGTVDGGSGPGPSGPSSSLGPLGPLGSLGEMISGVLGAPPAGHSAAGSGASAGPGASAGSASSAAGDAAEAAGAGTAPRDGHFATGTAECCVCPICRAIVALRDPSPEFSERLATGAGDFAAGVASLLRAFSTATAAGTTSSGTTASSAAAADPTAFSPTASDPTACEGGPDIPAGTSTPRQASAARAESRRTQMWREATDTGHDSWAAPEQDVWAVATRTDGAGRSGGAGAPTDAAGSPDAAETMAHEAIDRPVVPASRKPTSGTDTDDLSGDDA
ncbi:hypothetical protein ACWDV4_14575 [Micromonospora sp. NPDC003197]